MENLRRRPREDESPEGEPAGERRGHEPDFNSPSFSVGEYLTKITRGRLTEESVRTQRDKHLKVFTKYSALVSEEVGKQFSAIIGALEKFFVYRRMVEKTSQDLGVFYKPIYSYERKEERDKASVELFKKEMRKFKGGEADELANGRRYFVGKERVLLDTSDGATKEGVVVVSNDMLIMGVLDQDRDRAGRSKGGAGTLVFYNALLLKEVEISEKNSSLIIKLPPIAVEVKPLGQAGSLKNLKALLLKQSRSARSMEQDLREEEGFGEREYITDYTYTDFLVRTNQLDYLPKGVHAQHKALLLEHLNQAALRSCEKGRHGGDMRAPETHRYLGIMASMGKEKTLDTLFEVGAQKVERSIKRELEDQAQGLAQSDQGEALACTARGILKNHMREIEEAARELGILVSRSASKQTGPPDNAASSAIEEESVLRAKIALHFESLHIKTIHLICEYLFTDHISDKSNYISISSVAERVKEKFVYRGYDYSYTVKYIDELKRGYVKRRYTRNKEIVNLIFANL